MNGLKKPRRVRWPARKDAMRLAVAQAAALTPAARQSLMEPLNLAIEAGLQARMDSMHWSNLAMACAVALTIERQGVIRGLQVYLQAADDALQAIALRAEADNGWTPTPLYGPEIAALRDLVKLHEQQLLVLSTGEYTHAVNATLNRMQETKARGLSEEVN